MHKHSLSRTTAAFGHGVTVTLGNLGAVVAKGVLCPPLSPNYPIRAFARCCVVPNSPLHSHPKEKCGRGMSFNNEIYINYFFGSTNLL